MVERLALGTVQFGLQYGIANRAGQVTLDGAAAILERAWMIGMDTLDTAVAYGVSEERLGQIGVSQWKVVTKVPIIPESDSDVWGTVHEEVTCSLNRLKIPKLRGLLLHCPEQLRSKRGDLIFRALISLRDQGMTEKIGISVYHPEDLEGISTDYQFDIVQAPFNILDRRLDTSGWLNRLDNAGTEVHARSVFLQGILLMNATTRPPKFSRWQPIWDAWSAWLEEHGLTPIQACLAFALSESSIDRVIVGVDNVSQLEGIFAALGAPLSSVPAALMCGDLDLIDPSRWKTL